MSAHEWLHARRARAVVAGSAIHEHVLELSCVRVLVCPCLHQFSFTSFVVLVRRKLLDSTAVHTPPTTTRDRTPLPSKTMARIGAFIVRNLTPLTMVSCIIGLAVGLICQACGAPSAAAKIVGFFGQLWLER